MTQGKNRYIPAIDGLRTLAVLAVIAYHMKLPYAIGGLGGVTVFFVISGYLITGLLITELKRTRSINLPNFWLRRIRRLFPAILLVVLSTALLCTIFNHVLLTKMRPDIAPSLFFFNNWWQIFHDISYFDDLGSPSPLTHFWSLSIEEQFYLVWPCALLICYKLGVTRKKMRQATAVLIIISALEMALLYIPSSDPSRVYYGTDTRAFSLLIGAWLAFKWPSSSFKLTKRQMKYNNQKGDTIGIAALVLLVLMLCTMDGSSPFPYYGGVLIVSILSALVIASAVLPNSLLAQFFGLKPLVWIGKRSYGMYLWHYPIILLMSSSFTNAAINTTWWWQLLELAITITASHLSYTFIENPIRKGSIKNLVNRIKNGEITFVHYAKQKAAVYCVCAVIIVGASIGISVVPNTQIVNASTIQRNDDQQAQDEQHNKEALTQSTSKNNIDATPNQSSWRIILIGDSVTVACIDQYQEAFPSGIINAAVSRYPSETAEIYRQYKSEGWRGDAVLISLGVNGPISIQDLENTLQLMSENELMFVFTCQDHNGNYGPKSNSAIREFAGKYPNRVRIIDWESISSDHDDWFWDDAIHLRPEGANAYVAMTQDALLPYEKRFIATQIIDTIADAAYTIPVSLAEK